MTGRELAGYGLPDNSRVEFGPFRLEPTEGRLLRDGREVPLPPKVLDTLIVLVGSAGRLVTKEALLKAVWKDAFVEEGSVTYTISILRKKLGETSDCRYIETVPKRGYRFTGVLNPEQPSVGAWSQAVQPPGARRPTRIIVAPFRSLKPDAETDFLAFSLPEALAGALAAIRSLCVLWKTGVGAAAAADVALDGTVVRLGDSIRVTARLLESDSSMVLWSNEWQIALRDLLAVQRDLTRSITESLAGPLSALDRQTLSRHVPSTAVAYEYYLRANQLAYEASQWDTALELYRQSLVADPSFAPAWARLARCHRLLAKFARGGEMMQRQFREAERAFQRALELDPESTLAHGLYAQLEVDLGRASDAMCRLVSRGLEHPDDPHLLAGLVHACRFCGLLAESKAAHDRARQIDPGVPTSVAHTCWQLGDCEGALKETFGDIGYMPGLALLSLGRTSEALVSLKWREQQATDNRTRTYVTTLRALAEGHRAESLAALDRAAADLVDAEALFYLARTYAYWGETEKALTGLSSVVHQGFFCARALAQDSWLDSVRSDARFERLQLKAATEVARAQHMFRGAGAGRLLGTEV